MNAEAKRFSLGEIGEREVSLFNTVKSKRNPSQTKVHALLYDIQHGKWSAEIEQLRSTASIQKRDKLKLRLPAVKWSGTFTGLSASDLIEHSGLLCLDFDDLGSDPGRVRKLLREDGYVLAFFTSPRARGLKVLVTVVADDGPQYRLCFDSARAHYEELLPKGVKLDSAPSNVASNCVVSYDPNLWRALDSVIAFLPLDRSQSQEGGCHIGVSHAIQSNEKELPPLPSPCKGLREGMHDSATPSTISTLQCLPPLPPVIRLPDFADATLWPKWVKRVTYVAGQRNENIAKRVPILINLASEEIVALLLLRWFNEAPDGLFKDSAARHWLETWSAIKGCVESWPNQNRISEAEMVVYQMRRDQRQRSAYRICRSLSLAKKNNSTRTFFLSAGQLGDRLGCDCKTAGRQLGYLQNISVIEVAKVGRVWATGRQSRSTTYRWMLR